jgi:hypothetical protein
MIQGSIWSNRNDSGPSSLYGVGYGVKIKGVENEEMFRT